MKDGDIRATSIDIADQGVIIRSTGEMMIDAEEESTQDLLHEMNDQIA